MKSLWPKLKRCYRSILLYAVIGAFVVGDLVVLKIVKGNDKKAAVLESIPGTAIGALVAFLLARWQLREEKRGQAALAELTLQLVADELGHNNRILNKLHDHFNSNISDPVKWQHIMADLAQLSNRKYDAYLSIGLSGAAIEDIRTLERLYNSVDRMKNELQTTYGTIEGRRYNMEAGLKPLVEGCINTMDVARTQFTSIDYQKFTQKYPGIL